MEYLGKWWNDKNIEIYKIGRKNIALYGWNGDIYTECFEVSKNLMDIKRKNIRVQPIYAQINEDTFEVINYKIVI